MRCTLNNKYKQNNHQKIKIINVIKQVYKNPINTINENTISV